MKKTLFSFMLTVLFTVVLSINVFAMTAEERDLYNHQYYPQSVNNGGINQTPQESKHDFYVNPATGNATVRVTDFILPGKNGFDLEVSRVYNSFSSNLYEPYVEEIPIYTETPFYIVVCEKDYEKVNISNTLVDSGYGVSVCVNANYYNYSTDNNKYSNMSKFEFDEESYTEDDVFASYSEALALANSLNNKNPDINASYPVSTVGSYWANYKNCFVRTVYIDVYTPDYETGLLPDTSSERHGGIGAGWEFDFPYIEKRYGDDWFEYLHFGDKGVWEIDTSSDGGTNGLLGYTLNDIILDIDRSVTHDGYDSEYCVTEKDGTKSYFADDGRLLLQKDRYGNEIKYYCDWEYYWDTEGKRRKYPYLTGITDSVGRTVTISYGSDYTSSGITYKKVTLTVTDPTNSANSLEYVYRLKQLNNKSLDGDLEEYVLDRVYRPDGESSYYSYWNLEAPVDFFDRNGTFENEYSDYKNSNTGNSYITKATCEFDGYNTRTEAGQSRKWRMTTSKNTSIRDEGEEDSLFITLVDLSKENEYDEFGHKILELYFYGGNGYHYMSDFLGDHNRDEQDFDYISYRYETADGSIGHSSISVDEAYKKYKIRLISWNASPPISNEFK